MALNVLIVDDSSLTRKRIRRIIEMVDLEVGRFLEAGNGVEALRILGESRVDLVLADLNMPEMGGAEMVRRMKTSEATKSIPVVVVSTESRTTRIKDLLVEGVKGYLHKPFTPEEFKRIMDSLWTGPCEEVGALVTQAMSHALETMAFMTVLPPDDDLAEPDETISATISFFGPKSGTIEIVTGVDCASIIAENISGAGEVDENSCCDGLKELSNVVCGLFLPMVVSSTADIFEITVPSALIGDEAPRWREFAADENTRLTNVEGFLVATRLTIEDCD
jgi:two-component system chemotaxis response regulator CheY